MTLKEVAKRAGVSHTTVSLVVNNVRGSRVSEETRRRVWEAVRALDYNPNVTAKRLASGKTHAVGLYVPFGAPIFRNYRVNEEAAGIQEVLSREGYDLVVFASGVNLGRDRPLEEIVKQKSVDGLIVFNTRYTTRTFVDRYVRNLAALDFPFVILDYYWGRKPVNYVGLDYQEDVRRAVAHLTGLGHERVALITGNEDALVTPRLVKGYRGALERAGVPFDPDLVVPGDYRYEPAYAATLGVLERHPDVTAFFVGGYEMAPACLRAVKETGRAVPGDVSVVGYIDSEASAYLDPPLTAVRIPYYEMGRQAAELLLSGGERRKVRFETELVVRGSTAPAPRRAPGR